MHLAGDVRPTPGALADNGLGVESGQGVEPAPFEHAETARLVAASPTSRARLVFTIPFSQRPRKVPGQIRETSSAPGIFIHGSPRRGVRRVVGVSQQGRRRTPPDLSVVR